MVMSGRAGQQVHADCWSTQGSVLEALLVDAFNVQVLEVLDEVSPWPGENFELVTDSMREEDQA